jgi:hypothetical protein
MPITYGSVRTSSFFFAFFRFFMPLIASTHTPTPTASEATNAPAKMMPALLQSNECSAALAAASDDGGLGGFGGGGGLGGGLGGSGGALPGG